MQIPFEKLFSVLIAETMAKRGIVFVFFFVISLSLLAVGSFWPKKYTAYTIIQIDDTNILQPLMRGAAETTRTIDHATNAREIIFGEKIMHQVLGKLQLFIYDFAHNIYGCLEAGPQLELACALQHKHVQPVHNCTARCAGLG